MYGSDILCGISKGTFEIPHRIPTHTLKDVDFVHNWKFKSSYIQELISVFETSPDADNFPMIYGTSTWSNAECFWHVHFQVKSSRTQGCS